MSANITVEYVLNSADSTAFNHYFYRSSPAIRQQFMHAWIVRPFNWFLVVNIIWFFVANHNVIPLDNGLDFLPVIFLIWVLYLIIYPWAFRRKIKRICTVRPAQAQGPPTVLRTTITAERISEESKTAQYSTLWCAVSKVIEDEEHIYIFGTAVIMIPSRAFPSKVEFGEFFRTIKQYHENAIVKTLSSAKA